MGTLIHKVAHGLSADQRVYLVNLVGGDGLDMTTLYYVLAAGLTADDFAVGLTSGGAAVVYTTDITAGDIFTNDSYTIVADGVMDAPTTPAAPDPVVLTSLTVSSVVRLYVTVPAPADINARVRGTEVQITHAFDAAVPNFDQAINLFIPTGTVQMSIPALGLTLYNARSRTQDTYGNYSDWSATVALTTDDVPDSRVIIDNAITTAKIAPLAVTTANLAAQAITADKLAATIVLASLLKTANTGRRIELDIDGIRLYDASEGLLVRIPTNGDPVYVKGEVTADSLISQTAATFRTAVSLEAAAVATLQGGVAAPTNAPTVAASVDSLTLTTTPGSVTAAYGIGYDVGAGTFWVACDPSVSPYYVAMEYNASTGIATGRNIAATGSTSTVTTTTGSTSHVSDSAEGADGSTNSHIMTPITMPRLGNVTKVAAYFAGHNGSAVCRVGLWAADGTNLRESANFTAASGGATTVGGSDLHNVSLSAPLAVASGYVLYAGWRHTSAGEGTQWDRDDGSGKTTKSSDGTAADASLGSFGTLHSSSKPNVYITYTYTVDTRLETLPNIAVATDGTYVYTLDTSGVIWKYDRTTLLHVAHSSVQTAITGTKSLAGMFYDTTSGELNITTFTGTGAGVFPKIVRVTTSTLAVSATVYSAAAGTTYTGSTAYARGGARLSDPLGSANTYWLTINGAVVAYTFAGTALTEVSNRTFGTTTTVKDGLTHDGTQFRGWASATPTKVWKFSNWDFTTASTTLWVGYSWYDGSSEKSGTGTAATDLINCVAHGLIAGDRVSFTTLTGGTGLVANTDYWVLAAGLTADVFKVSSVSSVGATTDITVNYSALTFGSSHETAMSPRASSITVRRRERVLVTTPAIPSGGVTDPNYVRIYMLQNATDTGAGTFWQQITDALTSRYAVTYTGSGIHDGAGAAFPAGTAAEIKSAVAGWSFKGDGTMTTTKGIVGMVPVVRVYTGSTSWSKPTGLSHLEIEVIGGGGAGGGAAAAAASQNSKGSGGGSGSYAKIIKQASALGSTETVTIGPGGTGVSASTGNTGTDTSFGTWAIGKGGTGGTVAASSASAGFSVTGGAGGVAGTGDVTTNGTPGQPGIGSATLGNGGDGGAALYGGGGRGAVSGVAAASVTGGTGVGWGSGGGGALSTAGGAAATGGAGAAGVCIVTEYYGP